MKSSFPWKPAPEVKEAKCEEKDHGDMGANEGILHPLHDFALHNIVLIYYIHTYLLKHIYIYICQTPVELGLASSGYFCGWLCAPTNNNCRSVAHELIYLAMTGLYSLQGATNL